MKVLWPAGFDLFQLTFVFQFPVPARRKIPQVSAINSNGSRKMTVVDLNLNLMR